MATRTTKTTAKTTTKRSTSRTTKPRSTKTAAPKPAAAPKPKRAPAAAKPAPQSAPVVVDAPKPIVSGPVMRKKELVDAVVARSAIKKKYAKPAVEMALEILGEALQSGRSLDLQPMGKVMIKREKKLAAGKVLTARIRQSKDLPPSDVAETAAPASPPGAGGSAAKTPTK